jgi:tRNA pseudouridine38-40 synthase
MAKFKMYIEYEGTRYSGWQMQQNARTIQGMLYKAAHDIFGRQKVDIQGAGRTDSGVHALCQIAHLDANTMLAPEIIKMKFNDQLPPDINLLEVEKTSKTFHARHDAVRRSYLYQVSRRRTAFGKNYVWWIKDKLDFNAMKENAGLFTGMHDFQSFADRDKEDKSTKVKIEEVELKEWGDLILIRITGSHFLWKMVRRLTGVLVESGRGNIKESDIRNFLAAKSSQPAEYTAPPSGLFLELIQYERKPLPELAPVQFVNNYLNHFTG